MEIKWRGELVEEVREFTYLGYVLSRNNGNVAHSWHLERKAKTVLGKV